MQYVLSNGGAEMNKILKIGDQLKFKDWYKLASKINEVKAKDNGKLPWHEIDVGITDKYLRREYDKMLNSQITPWCEEDKCYGCGAC